MTISPGGARLTNAPALRGKPKPRPIAVVADLVTFFTGVNSKFYGYTGVNGMMIGFAYLLCALSPLPEARILLEWDGVGPSVLSLKEIDEMATDLLEDERTSLTDEVRMQLLLRRGAARYYLEDYTAAEKDVQLVVETRENDYSASWQLARIRIELGDVNKRLALAWAEEAMERKESSPLGFRIAGLYYAKMGKFDRAIELLTKAVRRGSRDPCTISWRARVYMEAGHPLEALMDIEKAMALPPMIATRAQSLCTMRGIILLRLRRYKESIATLSHAYTMDTKDVDTQGYLWMSLIWDGQYETAAFVARRMIDRDEECHVGNSLYALSLAEMGDLPAASSHAEKAVLLSPKDVRSLSVLARVRSASGDWQGAANAYHSLIELGRAGYHPDWYLHFALFFATCPDDKYRLGNTARRYAAACVDTYKNEPNLRTALIVLAITEAECGEFDKALEILGRVRRGNIPKDLDARLQRLSDLFANHKPYRHETLAGTKEPVFSLPICRKFDDTFFYTH